MQEICSSIGEAGLIKIMIAGFILGALVSTIILGVLLLARIERK